MKVDKIEKQVKFLLLKKGLEVTNDILGEFLVDDRYGHSAVFEPDKLEDGALWFGAGSLSDALEVISVSNEEDVLIALALVGETQTEIWFSLSNQWEVLEGNENQ